MNPDDDHAPINKPGVSAEIKSGLRAGGAADISGVTAIISASEPQSAGQTPQNPPAAPAGQSRLAAPTVPTSNPRYRDLFERAPVAYCLVDKSGHVLEANQAMATLLRESRDRLLNTPLSRFIVPKDHHVLALLREQMLVAATAAPSARSSSAPDLDRAAGAGRSVSCRLRMLRTDGEPFRARWEVSAAHAGNDAAGDAAPAELRVAIVEIGSHVDVTPGVDACDFAYRALFEQATDAILFADADGKILEANASASDLFGYSADEFAGLDATAVLVIGDFPPQAPQWQILRASGRAQAEGQCHRKDGTAFPASISTRPTAGNRMFVVIRDISARRDAERLRLGSEQRLRDLVDSTRGIAWEADASTCDFVAVSGDTVALTGYPAGDWLQPGFWADHIHAEDREWVLQRCRDSTEDRDFEYRLIASDGRTVWLRAFVRTVMDNGQPRWLRGLMIDITAHRRAQDSIRASEAEFRGIINASPVPMVLKANDQRLTFMNPAFTQTFGYVPEDIPNLAVWWQKACPDPAYRHRVASAWRAEVIRVRRTGEAFTPMELQISTRAGTARIVLASLAPIGTTDDAGHVVVFHDITRHKQMEQRLLQTEKLASIGLLAAGVAHEINNPIAFVNSNIGSLRQHLDDLLTVVDAYEAAEAAGGLAREQRARIEAVKANVELDYLRKDLPSLLAESTEGLDRVKRIIEGLRDFSQTAAIDAWQQNDVIESIDSTVKMVWSQLKHKCDVHKAYSDLPRVECVLPQLNQLIMNLLLNAANAIAQHGTISIRTGRREDEVWIEIADTGSGIEPAHLAHIFDPFFTTREAGRGVGLGLSVSHGIVRRHHGRIEVDSELGKGSTFRVWLPIRQPTDTREPPQRNRAVAPLEGRH